MHYIKYLIYVIRHKYYVMVECFKVGLYWRGLIHDMSKLLPSEFFPYANHFSGGIQTGRNNTGYYKPTNTGDFKFDWAWLLHQKRNRHHWQFYILPEDEGGLVILPMSYKDRLEMLCDWRGAGKAQYKPDTLAWYKMNHKKMQLHQETRKWVEENVGFNNEGNR